MTLAKRQRNLEIFTRAAAGESCSDIAAALGMSTSAVYAMLYYYGKNSGRNAQRSEAKRRRNADILARLRAGQTQSEVADALKVSHHTVFHVIRREAPELVSVLRQRWREQCRQRGVKAKRNAVIAERFRSGQTLQEIGDAYGLTRERVRQIVRRQDPDAVKPPADTITLEEVARQWGASPSRLRLYARRMNLTRWHGDYRLTIEDREKLRAALSPCCRQCGVPLPFLCVGVLCSEGCRTVRAKKSAAATRQRLLSTPAHEGNLTGWAQEAFRALEKLPDRGRAGEWAYFSEARELAGITHMQLSWLTGRGVVDTTSDPAVCHMVTKKPLRRYYVAQMRAVAGAYRAWRRKQERRRA